MLGDDFFIGRKAELAFLEKLYGSKSFEMIILHGRHRGAKSYLLGHFANLHKENTVYFIGDKSSEKTNVRNFCEKLNKVLKAGDFLNSFEQWSDVYSFLKNTEISERLVIIIDEFTYLFNSNPAYDSGLKIAIHALFDL